MCPGIVYGFRGDLCPDREGRGQESTCPGGKRTWLDVNQSLNLLKRAHLINDYEMIILDHNFCINIIFARHYAII